MNAFFIDDIICANFNSNVLGDLCDEVEERGLTELLSNCNRRLTLFAPNNGGFQTFFGYFDAGFFSDPDNFVLQPVQDDIILDPGTVRKLEVDEDFEQEFMSEVLGYHLLDGIFRVQDLECDASVNMVQRGTTTTLCDNDAKIAQMGTCNGLTPNFSQTNIVAANGIIHVMSQVLIPSPNGAVGGCDEIGPFPNPGGRAIIIAGP